MMNNRLVRMVVLGLVLTLIVAVIGIPAVAVKADSDREVVYPTGLYPQDVDNVQAAVNAGGTVHLKATNVDGDPTAFEFGPPEEGSGHVFLSTDVTILGERVGERMTTIHGGFPPFSGDAPTRTTIRDIHFESPGIAALLLVESSRAEFSHNKVTEVVGLPNYAGLGIAKGQAVWISAYVGSDPNLIHGEVLISDNVIEGINAELGYGLALYHFGAQAHIERNEIRGADTGGILVGLNTQDVWVENNLIVPGPARYSPFGSGNGIMAQESLGGRFFVHGNTVECDNPFADGIYLAGSELLGAVVEESAIEENRVIMHDSFFAGVTLYGSVHHSHVEKNQIEGSGAFALQVSIGFFPNDIATANAFLQNRINRFDSQVADVFFGTNSQDTEFEGFCRSVLDLGEDNHIQCIGSAQNSSLQQIGQLREAKLATIKALEGSGSAGYSE